MKYSFICLALLLALSTQDPIIPKDGEVLILTDDNFDDVIELYPYVLVKFFAPWCGHCKKLAPKYIEAAQQLSDDGSEIKLAELDATENPKVAEKFEVKGYPTLKFFVNQLPIDYVGSRDKEGIVQWVNKKTQPSTTELTTSEEIEKAKTNNEVVILFFGSDQTTEFSNWQSITRSFDDYVFHHVFDSELAAEYKVESEWGIVIFKQFDEGRNDFEGKFEHEEILEFITSKTVQTIMEFTQKSAQLIFGEGSSCLILFVEAEGSERDSAMEALESASSTLKGKILMAHSGYQDGLGQRLADYIGVTEEHIPTLRIVVPDSGKVAKYLFEGEITSEAIISFYERFEKGEIDPFVKSEEIPESQEEAVIKVVGKQWKEIVLDETKDVLVKYYAPWCGHCKKIAPIYLGLAEKLAGLGNLVMAEMDATANEVDEVSISGFPTILFYAAGDKAPHTFDGERTEEGFLKYLKEHTTDVVDWSSIPEEVVEEEPEKEEEELKLNEEDKEQKEYL